MLGPKTKKVQWSQDDLIAVAAEAEKLKKPAVDCAGISERFLSVPKQSTATNAIYERNRKRINIFEEVYGCPAFPRCV